MVADFTHTVVCTHAHEHTVTQLIFHFFVVSLFIMVKSAFEPGPYFFDDSFVGHNLAEMKYIWHFDIRIRIISNV